MKTIIAILISILFILTVNYSYSQYTDQEKSGLLFTLQEEKAAYDFYTEMFTKYNEKVFENVKNAEKQHYDHVLNLLNELNINANDASLAAGEFSHKDVTDLYNELMTIGGYSFTDALRAAVRFEEKDISDLRKYYSEASNESIRELYQCLDNASQNHLRAFVKKLKKEGISYKPDVLSAEEYNTIINSANSPGNCFQIK